MSGGTIKMQVLKAKSAKQKSVADNTTITQYMARYQAGK